MYLCGKLRHRPIDIDRRGMLRLVGGGAVLLGSGLASRPALAAGGTDALLLNCIDYRLTAATERYMAQHGMAGKYDQLVLAGALARRQER